MKIKIITLHQIFNYGSVLQTYATQKIFEKYSSNVEVINYISPVRTAKELFLAGPYRHQKLSLIKILYYLAKGPSLCLKGLTFGSFVKKNINLTKKKYIQYEDLENNVPIADIYVTGSDQVWNSFYNGGVDSAYFLGFVRDNTKRIAYCSSFGSKEIVDSDKTEIGNYLKAYDAISVRESSAVEIVKDLSGKEAMWLIDPTLQIDKEDWGKLSEKRKIKDKYLLLFLPYTEKNDAFAIAKKVAAEKKLKIVGLSWKIGSNQIYDKQFLYASPKTFLSLIQYAEIIITNSFHGVAFSYNFNKDFIAIRRDLFNERIDSLLNLTGLSKRQISEVSEISQVRESIDYAEVNKVLTHERNKANRFLDFVMRESGLNE